VNAPELLGLVIFVFFFALPIGAVLISTGRNGRIR
jgi:hypothetical protein